MYIILVVIAVILVLELYLLIKNVTPDFNCKTTFKPVDISADVSEISKLNKYTITGDKMIHHGPGKIMITGNYNVFIDSENYSTLMKKDHIYDIDTPFKLEILSVSKYNQNIIYYYISK